MTHSKKLSLDWTKAHDVIPLEKEIYSLTDALYAAKSCLLTGSGPGGEFTGWLHYFREELSGHFKSISKTVETITSHSDAVVVVGIGGSLLGSKAIYEALTHRFSMLNPAAFHKKPLLLWAGHHLATDELAELLDALDGLTPSMIVISKSGGTTEPALAFRVLKKYFDERFGHDEAAQRIFAITDPNDGTLLKIAKQNQYPTFPIPKNIGGRYSVFTPVGLLPLAVAGIDVAELIAGATQACDDVSSMKNNSIETNPALCYAAIRHILYKGTEDRPGKKVEALSVWSPKLTALAEWWKQLFGESDGKEHSGLYPASVMFTTDLHSMGQYFQEGERHLFATHIKILDEYSLTRGTLKRKIKIPECGLNDGFQYLVGQELSDIQREAQLGTFLAHSDGKVPTLVWEIPELSAWWMGYWMFVNMFSCGIGGYLQGINPFDQPGVEAYKVNMFALLGKPQHMELSAQLKQRLQSGKRLKSVSISEKV